MAYAIYFKGDKRKMSKTKVTMEVEVEDIEAFIFTTSELGSIAFSKATGANILKMKIKEK